MKKIFGAFYEVSEKRELDFTNISAVNFELAKCAKGDLKIEFTEDKEKQGLFIGGHAEAHNKPEIHIRSTPQVYTIRLEQEKTDAEGMLHLTLVLPNKKFNSITAVGRIMEYEVNGGQIEYINLTNEKGDINVDIKSRHVCLFSRWYSVNAKIEATGRALYQIGSRIGDVNISLKNVKEIHLHRKPADENKYIEKFRSAEKGYLADIYLPERVEGMYIIQ